MRVACRGRAFQESLPMSIGAIVLAGRISTGIPLWLGGVPMIMVRDLLLLIVSDGSCAAALNMSI